MKLNHLNLTVTDPVETQEFLIKYFALKPRGKGNHHMAFLSDDNGIVLSLMNPKVGRESEVNTRQPFTSALSRKANKPLMKSTSA